MFKVYRNTFPPIVKQLFQLRNIDYNLLQFSQFDLPNVRSAYCGTESISSLGTRIWNIVPNECKKQTSLDAFKKLIKKWQHENCRRRLCKSYIKNLGVFLAFFFCMYMAFVSAFSLIDIDYHTLFIALYS